MDSKDTETKVPEVSSEIEDCDAAAAPSVEVGDKDETRKALRKVDKRLLPMLALLYLLAFLDRGNIGNARTLGMQEQLGLNDAEWNISLTIFFFPYSIFEIPSNMVLKLLKPNVWLAILVVAWGTVTTLSGLVQNYTGLLIARFFLGVTEAGFFPAATYLLTCWYVRYEMQGRLSIFFCTGSLAGAFSGLLAYALSKMDGVGGLSGWRWIFIIEGIFTTFVGVLVWFIMPNSPSESKFLTPREREILCHRLENDNGQVQTSEKFQKKYIWAALLDWKIWLSVLVYWGNSICTYGFIYTLPTVIFQLGYTAQIAQLMTIPVYFWAMLVTLSSAFLSDRYKNRSNFILYPFMIAAVGFMSLLAIPHPRLPGLTYGMLFVVAGGLYPTICGILSWNANNLAGTWKRSIGMGLQICVGNLGGAIGSNIFLARQAPNYWLGYGFSMGMIIVAIISGFILKFFLTKENKKRALMTAEEIMEKYSEQELLEMGDRAPTFRYTM